MPLGGPCEWDRMINNGEAVRVRIRQHVKRVLRRIPQQSSVTGSAWDATHSNSFEQGIEPEVDGVNNAPGGSRNVKRSA